MRLNPEIEDSYVACQIRRCTTTLLAVNAVILACILLFALVERRYVYNFIAGPFPLDRAAPRSVDSETSAGRFVSLVLAPDELSPPAVKEFERTASDSPQKSEKVVAEYDLARVGDRLLVVKLTPGQDRQHLAGEIVPLPAAVRDALTGPVLPLMLNASDFRQPGYVSLLVCGPLFAVAVWNIGRAFRRRARPETHPIARFLIPYGPLNDIAREIDNEVAAPIARLGRIVVTPGWILQPDLYDLHACGFRDVIWAYPQSTKYSAPHAAVTARGVIIWDRYKRQIPFLCQAAHALQLLEIISRRAPSATIGYSTEMAARVKRDWSSVVAAADGHAATR